VKNRIFENGYYSEQKSCPKCGYKGDGIYKVDGKPTWILDQIKKDNGIYEYVCSKCRFRWQESKETIEANNEDNLISRIKILEQNYKTLSKKYKDLLLKIEKLENASLQNSKINIPAELDGDSGTFNKNKLNDYE